MSETEMILAGYFASVVLAVALGYIIRGLLLSYAACKEK